MCWLLQSPGRLRDLSMNMYILSPLLPLSHQRSAHSPFHSLCPLHSSLTTANVYDQLNGGATAYTAVATHTPTGCVSAVASTPVANVQTLPALTTSITSSTNCAVGKENGKANVLTVDGTAVGVAAGYTYAWTGPAAFPVNIATSTSNTAQLSDNHSIV